MPTPPPDTPATRAISSSATPLPLLVVGGVPCRLYHRHYATTGRTALHLVALHDHTLVATATLNLPDLPLQADEVLLKTWDENEGLLEVLITAGVVHRPHDHYPVGHRLAPIVSLVLVPP